MADIYQGSMNTISPAFGAYKINVSINIDKETAGLTGPLPTGMPEGQGTLEPVNWLSGVTGMNGVNTNLKPTWF